MSAAMTTSGGDRELVASPTSIPAPTRKDRSKLPTLAESVKILPIEFLWEHFELPGQPNRSCLSPFRSEQNPSFSVFTGEDGRSRFKDHAAPEVRGDSFDFFQIYTGQSASKAAVPFRRLARSVRDGEIQTEPGIAARVRVRAATTKPFTKDERERARRTTCSLLWIPRIQEEIARGRDWKVETIRELAREGSLGCWKKGISFLYRTGMKVRWDRAVAREIRWVFGGPSSMWREQRVAAAGTIYVTEGESDAITLIDAGMENDGRTAVVALPSATTLSPSFVPLFAGKHVILCLDADKAGECATNKFGSMLQGNVASLAQLDLKGALQ